ncbi:phosphoribosylformylglycinamidine cyclo-ligase [Tindallia californiensis]|uniref:Phosphoribosylformylglycinamidine cyclo-ligase n=1 Tax=Tindallia californiensis TaxID=159292 RepID=A0A1H3L662_9FIRM|nr:phosphoribosylformylglycinamidine cyclo-ligase [Tindallia californiensis]SDY59689.1 phosphoribosylformylglycinamidine cyclo-ligase [Tindallia californiensis]
MEKVTYESAGVNVEEGQRSVELMKKAVQKTMTKEVLQGLGSFGAMVQPDLKGMNQPVLVSGTDGVGTKLKLAFMMDRHDTIGQDCVAMCVNDILCHGAQPLFFLDYLATGKLEAEKAAAIVAGIAEACQKAGCALVGGETAEMPGFYQNGEYDLAGFAVGMVDRDKLITGETITAGDAIIGLASSGVHSNGFSLVRKVLLEKEGMDLWSSFGDSTLSLGEALLTPTSLYVKPIMEMIQQVPIKGLAHITGGGFYENIPRILPDETAATIWLGSWHIPDIFHLLKEKGPLDQEVMYGTFNMGIGMILVVSSEEKEKAMELLRANDQQAWVIGEVTSGNKQVTLCDGSE